MPPYAFANLGVIHDLGISSARSEGGLVITSRRSDPFWQGPMTTVKLGQSQGTNQHADFLAFLSRCVDLNILVDFVHPLHRVPVSYTVATWPMSGNAELASVTDLRHVVVQDLVDGLLLKRGDRVSLVQGNLICHRWIATDLTVSSEISQTLELTPRLPFGVFAPGAAVVLKDPPMRVMIVPGSWDASEGKEPSSVTFEVSESLT